MGRRIRFADRSPAGWPGRGVGRAMMAHAFYESPGFEGHGYRFRVELDPSKNVVE